MSKVIKAKVRMQLPAGKANPAPPVGSSLGPHGINLMEFCKQFNALTSSMSGQTAKVPVIVTIYTDKKFDILIKTSTVSDLIKGKIKLAKGSAKPGGPVVGRITWKEIEEIAHIKMPDLNAIDIEAAKKSVAGSARSMGLEVVN